ncbi:MAG TPA: hypothetical protein DCD96_08415 [Flavobacteriales bacterium]|nr:hypothetical protein [Flavobacteriales bacterium]
MIPLLSTAKGGKGFYCVSGVARSTENGIIKNSSFKITHGAKESNGVTDSNGKFRILVEWQTACPSGISRDAWNNENARLNPEYIYITFQGITLRIENEWEKYAGRGRSPKKVTRKLNLEF